MGAHIVFLLRSIAALCALVVLTLAGPAGAFDERALGDPFDPADLSRAELRYLQAALAFTNDYNALLDGDWGRGSQNALESFATRAGIIGPPPNWMVVMLAEDLLARQNRAGWAMTDFGPLGMSLLVPRDEIIDAPPDANFINFHHARSSLSYSLGFGTALETRNYHDFTLARAGLDIPYSLRRDSLWITSSIGRDGVTLYTRSDLVNGSWSTIMLSAQAGDAGTLNAVAGSIQRGSPLPLTLPPGGALAAGMISVSALLADTAPQAPAPQAPAIAAPAPLSPAAPPPATDPAPVGTGTGFVVSAQGHILTNDHVIAGCLSVTVDGSPARVLARDGTFDLALLDTGLPAASPALFATRPIGLNADILIAGYPLRGLLSGLNVTRGSITAERGIGDDSTRMQMSAPVQPGNSGGPVLAADGTIAGVVVSKLDAGAVAEMTGDIPQNVNFAIRGEMAQFFLLQNGLTPMTAAPGPRLDPEELARRAQEITRLIECR